MTTITLPNDHPHDSISFNVLSSSTTSYDSTNPLEDMMSYERVNFVRVPVYHRIADTEFRSYRWVPRNNFELDIFDELEKKDARIRELEERLAEYEGGNNEAKDIDDCFNSMKDLGKCLDCYMGSFTGDISIDVVKLIDGSIYIRNVNTDCQIVDFKVVCDEDKSMNDMSLPKELFEL